MTDSLVLINGSTAIRKLPINFNGEDIRLFEHELKKEIPETKLRLYRNITVHPSGLISDDGRVLPESFVTLDQYSSWKESNKAQLKFLIKYYLSKPHTFINQDVFWISDNWSQAYFHWITDALPRLFVIRDRLLNSILLLPKKYIGYEYILSSLAPFAIQDLRFIDMPIRCETLKIPTHTAPTGNYNEKLINQLREFYISFYNQIYNITNIVDEYEKIYISRSKSNRRKIVNEQEVIITVKKYGFKVIYFEDYVFDIQVKIALNAEYVISNHGAGLTNILFMKSGGNVLELRENGDSQNNCYFALASALDLNYFYQLCQSDRNNDSDNKGDLFVNCKLLEANIKFILRNDQRR